MPRPAALREDAPPAMRRRRPMPTLSTDVRLAYQQPLPAPCLTSANGAGARRTPSARSHDTSAAAPRKAGSEPLHPGGERTAQGTGSGGHEPVGAHGSARGRGQPMVIHRALSSQGAIVQSVSRYGELPTPCQCRTRSARGSPCWWPCISHSRHGGHRVDRDALAREPHPQGASRSRVAPCDPKGGRSPYAHLSFHDIRCVV